MFEWKVEDLKLLEETKRGGTFIGDERVFSCESKLTREEKIEFVDKITEGLLTYAINLLEKFEKEKDNLKKDQFGNVKSISLQAWLRKNDERNFISADTHWHFGMISYYGIKRYIENNPLTTKSYCNLYDDFVDEIFHRVLNRKLNEEKDYFREHDKYAVKRKRIREYERKYDTAFGVEMYMNSDRLFLRQDRAERDLTEEEIDDIISKYEQIDALIEKLTEETDIKF